MKRFEATVFFIFIAIAAVVGIASAEDYCTPIDIMNVTLDQSGVWYNFTVYSDDCYTCTPEWFGLRLNCTPCSITSNFEANVTTAENAPLTVLFSDLSTGNITYWNWSFGDGQYSNEQNPTHTYTSNGIYTVMLYVANDAVNDWEIKYSYIYISESPILLVDVDADPGENMIDWSFSPKFPATSMPPLNIYIDSNEFPSETNYTAERYLVPQLEPNERHSITLVNATAASYGYVNAPVKATTKTLASSGEVYTLLIVCIAVLLAIIIVKNGFFVILASIFNILLAIFGMGVSSGYFALPYVFISLAIITGIFVIVLGLPRLKENLAWW